MRTGSGKTQSVDSAPSLLPQMPRTGHGGQSPIPVVLRGVADYSNGSVETQSHTLPFSITPHF